MSRQHPVARSFSVERLRYEATVHDWTTDRDRADSLILSRRAVDGRRRIIVWFMTDGRIRAAYHEFGNGQHVKLDGGLNTVLWHLRFWDRVTPK